MDAHLLSGVFAPQGEKHQTKKIEYHAAAGERRLLRNHCKIPLNHALWNNTKKWSSANDYSS
jgi:hypothetical protein